MSQYAAGGSKGRIAVDEKCRIVTLTNSLSDRTAGSVYISAEGQSLTQVVLL